MIQKIKNWLRFSSLERRLTIEAIVVHAVALVCIKLISLKFWNRHIVPLSRAEFTRQQDEAIRISREALNRARRNTGIQGACLSQSITLAWLLRRFDIQAELVLGTHYQGDGLAAHAWLEIDGTVINDNPDVAEGFTVLRPHNHNILSLPQKQQPLRPEFLILIALLRKAMTPSSSLDLQECADMHSWDPSYLAHLIEYHRLGTNLHHVLTPETLGLSEDSFRPLKEGVQRATYKAMTGTVELIKVSRLLDQKGLPHIVFKGQVLSTLMYGKPGLRGSNDIDLLTSPDTIYQAAKELDAAGYRRLLPDFVLTERQTRSYTYFYNQIVFQSPAGFKIELHSRCSKIQSLFPYTYAEIEKAARPVKILNHTVQTLGEDHTGLLLLLHGYTHLWQRLFWLHDASVFCHQTAPGFHEKASTAARLDHIPDSLASFRELHHLIYETPLSELGRSQHPFDNATFSKRFTPPAGQVEMAEKFNILNIGVLRSRRYFFASLKPQFAYPRLWKALPLPDRLFPLYYILTPPIKLWRYLRKQTGRVEKVA